MSELLEALGPPQSAAFHGFTPQRPAYVPLRQHEVLFGQLVMALDAAVLSASFFAAYAVRDVLPWYGSLLPLEGQLWVLGLVLVVSLTLARMAGLASSAQYLGLRPLLFTTVRVHVTVALLVMSTLYLMRAVDVSRLWIQTFMVVGGAALILERLAIRAALLTMATGERIATRRWLVVGRGAAVAQLHALLGSRPHWGARVHGFVAPGPADEAGTAHVPLLGVAADVPTLLDTMVFDDVIVTDDVTDGEEIQRLARVCLNRGVTFHTLLPIPVSPRAQYRTETLGEGLCLMSVEMTPQSALQMLTKRALDIVGAIGGLLVCGIAYVLVAPLIRLESDGGAIFQQIRVGRNGRLFRLYKFRTMRSDAEAQKAALAAANHMSGFLFKIKDDPRVTSVGRVLRRLYIDELPQFWNVLKGDMSLVGTRPPTPDEVARYAPAHRRRLSMRPGITGPWQARGNGSVTDFEEVVRMECEYIERWSLWLDISILLRTCRTVLRMGGQ